MVTASMTHEEYRNQVAQATLSTADRVSHLTAGNERLNRHTWSDEQLRSIPVELVDFAWQQSAALRAEFRSFDTFHAYWKQLQSKT